MAYQPRQNRNARSALGEPRAQAVVYGVWLTGILTGAVIFALFVFLIGNGVNGQRNIQTGKENQGQEVAPLQYSSEGCPSPEPCKIAQVEKWLAEMKSTDAQIAALAKQAYNGALSRGQANFARICIGCHYGPPEATSNGPWLGNLYQTGNLYNGKPVNDANVVTFILLGSQSHNLNTDGTTLRFNSTNPDGSIAPRSGGFNPMPAGIATPQQAVDIMLYLKQQTSKK